MSKIDLIDNPFYLDEFDIKRVEKSPVKIDLKRGNING